MFARILRFFVNGAILKKISIGDGTCHGVDHVGKQRFRLGVRAHFDIDAVRSSRSVLLSEEARIGQIGGIALHGLNHLTGHLVDVGTGLGGKRHTNQHLIGRIEFFQ